MISRCFAVLSGVLVVCVALLSSAALADDSQPGFLEFKETTANRYSVLWRTPKVKGKRSGLLLKLPKEIRNLTPPTMRELSDSWIERRLIETDANGLIGKRIEIGGLKSSTTQVLARFEFANGEASTTLLKPVQPWMIVKGPRSAAQVTWDYTILGFEHILGGFDHLLFVLALLLIVSGTRRLLIAITSFTVAHSLTLAAATLGLVWVPGPPVEATIALSILFLASELVKINRGKRSLTASYPWIVAFGFGLLHGLGFAGALADVGLPQHEIPVALLMFNVGVELGQLVFVAAVLATMLVINRLRINLPVWSQQMPAYCIGGISAFWFVERVVGFF